VTSAEAIAKVLVTASSRPALTTETPRSWNTVGSHASVE
jgi:hypothetical protein